jgi:hypothetical protein
MLEQKPFFKISLCLWIFVLVGFLSLPEKILAKDIKDNRDFIHWVSPGDSLNRIARQYLPLTDAITIAELIKEIRQLNGIQGSLIHPRQPLLIPLSPSTPVKAKTVPKQPDFEARGIYINRFSMACQKMTRLLDRLIGSGGNTVILDGKDMTGRLSYPSRVALANEIGAIDWPVIGDPAKLFHYLHQKGLHVGVRLVLFYDPLLAAKRPEVALRATGTENQQTEVDKLEWADPYQAVVQGYNLDIARELAEMGVDEIQFDYIRFPTDKTSQNATCTLDERKIPRYKIIADFLARARKILAPYKVLLSVDVFGIVAWGRLEDIRITGQNIEELAKHFDVVCPMIYPSHFYGPFQGIRNPGSQPFLLVSEACKRFSPFLNNREVTLRPWIQAFPFGAKNFDEEYILEELRALDQSASRGWMLWSAGNAYDVAWKALEQWNKGSLKGITASSEFIQHY